MDLGAFSISLAVQDLERSRAFYEKLGFEATGGSLEDHYLMMVNGETIIGLFQGMFEHNILTFNPGLNNRKEQVEDFTDVREIQRRLREQGIEPVEKADEDSTGPAHLTVLDPDNNPILIDQFF